MNLTLIFYILSFIWIISEIILSRVKKSDIEKSISNFDKNTLRKLWITIVLSVILGVVFSSFSFGRIIIFPYEQIVGLFLILFGLIIRWIAILKLKDNFTVDVNVRKDQKVVNEGIYKIIRHPSYFGSLVSFLGLGLVFVNIFSILIIIIPITITFLHRIKIEEKALIEEIGKDYIEYSKQTKKLIPFIY